MWYGLTMPHALIEETPEDKQKGLEGFYRSELRVQVRRGKDLLAVIDQAAKMLATLEVDRDSLEDQLRAAHREMAALRERLAKIASDEQ